MKKLLDLRKVLSSLEPVGQGRGIIMGVTRLLLLGPFYYIAIICQPKHFHLQFSSYQHVRMRLFLEPLCGYTKMAKEPES